MLQEEDFSEQMLQGSLLEAGTQFFVLIVLIAASIVNKDVIGQKVIIYLGICVHVLSLAMLTRQYTHIKEFFTKKFKEHIQDEEL